MILIVVGLTLLNIVQASPLLVEWFPQVHVSVEVLAFIGFGSECAFLQTLLIKLALHVDFFGFSDVLIIIEPDESVLVSFSEPFIIRINLWLECALLKTLILFIMLELLDGLLLLLSVVFIPLFECCLGLCLLIQDWLWMEQI